MVHLLPDVELGRYSPLFGFYGKFVVFQAAVEADMIALAAIGIAASVIGAFYYLKICKVIMFDDPAGEIVGDTSRANWTVLLICSIIISPLGWLATKPLAELADKAANALFFVI